MGDGGLLIFLNMGYLGDLLSILRSPMKGLRMLKMATTTTNGITLSAPAMRTAAIGKNRRRSINPQAGQALVVLGHAIEYLTDEFVHEGTSFSANNEQLEAIQLLMALNRQVYFECPELPSLGERFRSLLGLHAA